MKHKLRMFFRKVKHWVPRVFLYAKYSWTNNDWDWDYVYLYNLMVWKLTFMANNREKAAIVECCKRQTKQMRYAIFLLERLIAEDGYLLPKKDYKGRLFRHLDKYVEGWWD